MLFQVLGPLNVVSDTSGPLPLGGMRNKSVLAVLLARPEEALSADALIESIWGEGLPQRPRKALQISISRLRGAIGHDRIITRGQGYVLRASPDEIDASVFERLADEGRSATASGQLAAGRDRLQQALRLWSGDAYADFRYADLVRGEADRLDEQRLVAIEDLMECRLAMGEHTELVSELGKLVSDRPLRERLWGQYMVALYRSDRQSEALRAFSRLADLLGEQLGIEPSATLSDLEERILLQDATLSWTAGPVSAAPVTSGSPAESRGEFTNLPAPVSSLVGREREISTVCELLDDARLVTLTGPGGVGKTRLAIEAAARLTPVFRDGVRFVDLGAVTAPELVASTIAVSVGVTERPSEPALEAMVSHLADRAALLVLDNCEHLVEAASEAVNSVLQGAPGVRVLATSRERLAVGGEVAWTVPSLVTPDPTVATQAEIEASEGVALFLERAHAADPEFEVASKELAAVAEICTRVDGIPLAIELAAVRVRVLTPLQILERLSQGLDILSPRRRAAVPRHRTLKAAIDWSYRLLTDDEQGLFRSLSIFPGSFDLPAVATICFPEERLRRATELISGLVDKSLLNTRRRETTNRYTMLQPIRQFAFELTEEQQLEALGARHAEYYARLATEGERHLRGGRQAEWLGRFDDEIDNLRAALAWSIESGHVDLARRVASGCSWYWLRRGLVAEGKQALAAVLASDGKDGDRALAARLTDRAGLFAYQDGDGAGARELFQRSYAIAVEAGDARAQAGPLSHLAMQELPRGELDAAVLHLQEAVALVRALGDDAPPEALSAPLVNLGDTYYYKGQFDRAASIARELEVLAGETGSPTITYSARLLDALAAVGTEDYTQARTRFSDALAIAEDLAVPRFVALATGEIGVLDLAEGDRRAASDSIQRAISMYDDIGTVNHVAECHSYAGRLEDETAKAAQHYAAGIRVASGFGETLTIVRNVEGLAALLASIGELELSARLFGASDHVRATTGWGLPPWLTRLWEKDANEIRMAAGVDTFAAQVARGSRMSFETATEEALQAAVGLCRF